MSSKWVKNDQKMAKITENWNSKPKNWEWHGETNARLSWICVPGLPPLSISVSSRSIPKPFGVALVPTWKKNFFVSEISADPQKRPYGVKGASSRVKIDPNFLMKIYLKFIISWNSDKKSRAFISEDSLGPKVMIPQILGSAKISTTRGDFLKFWGCGSKIFKNFKSSKISKNIIFQHLLFFCCFLGKVG